VLESNIDRRSLIGVGEAWGLSPRVLEQQQGFVHRLEVTWQEYLHLPSQDAGLLERRNFSVRHATREQQQNEGKLVAAE